MFLPHLLFLSRTAMYGSLRCLAGIRSASVGQSRPPLDVVAPFPSTCVEARLFGAAIIHIML